MAAAKPIRYGIISDIHANLPALNVALDRLKAEGVEEILCLGDLVGYNASPVQVIRTIEESGIKTILCGNHDRLFHYCRGFGDTLQAGEVEEDGSLTGGQCGAAGTGPVST